MLLLASILRIQRYFLKSKNTSFWYQNWQYPLFFILSTIIFSPGKPIHFLVGGRDAFKTVKQSFRLWPPWIWRNLSCNQIVHPFPYASSQNEVVLLNSFSAEDKLTRFVPWKFVIRQWKKRFSIKCHHSFSLGRFRFSKIKIFFNHGEEHGKYLIKYTYFRALQIFENQNFLRPWWRKSKIFDWVC